MKTILTALSLIIGILPGIAQDAADPFVIAAALQVDRSKDRKSGDYIDDEILKALQEPRLDKGTDKDDLGVIRITVLRSFQAPLVLSWQITSEDAQSTLLVKRARMRIEGERRVYQGLDIDKRIPLPESQQKLLRKIWERVNFSELPQITKQEEEITQSMDGSTWIYEVAAEKSSLLFAKSNPLDLCEDGPPIPRQRLWKEHHLNTFAMMLWTLAGIEDSEAD